MNIRFTLNGTPVTLDTAPDRRVVDLLREELELTGTKEGCGSGECGACTILIDGGNRLSCLMLAAQLEGRTVTTIEGLGEGDSLHPLQEAFIWCGAIQCGFCSPGMILAASALLGKKPDPTREEIREGLSGNLCRCTGYQKIVDAVEAAAGPMNPNVAPPDAPAIDGGPGTPFRRGGQGGIGNEPGRQLPILQTDNHPGNRRSGGASMKKVLLPRSLPELWTYLDEEPEARIFTGGTDLLVQLRLRREAPPALICLERIAELQDIGEEKDYLRIGAGVTHSHLLADPRITEGIPVLAKAVATLGSPPIRTMGTIGGNICTASPAGDTLPPLYILEAEVELCSAKTKRIMPLGSFILGPGKTQLEKGEIMTAVRVKKPTGYNLHHFEKIGQRKALACSIASLAALTRISPTGAIEAVRLAWGSVGPTVVTSAAIEAILIGEKPSAAVFERAAEAVRHTVSPIDDLRGTADYRRTVAVNLLRRLVTIRCSSADRLAPGDIFSLT